MKTTDMMSAAVHNDVWSRGCEYVFEHYENGSVVVTCYNKNDKAIWDGSTVWYKGDRIVDVIRNARQTSILRKAEYGC